jgi:hypothetical protein
MTLQRLSFSILVYPSDVSSVKIAHLPRHPFVLSPCLSHVLFRLICWDKRDGRTHLDLELEENTVEIGVCMITVSLALKPAQIGRTATNQATKAFLLLKPCSSDSSDIPTNAGGTGTAVSSRLSKSTLNLLNFKPPPRTRKSRTGTTATKSWLVSIDWRASCNWLSTPLTRFRTLWTITRPSSRRPSTTLGS